MPDLPSLEDLDRNPFLVLYELTQACDLACRHCRASAQALRHPDELTEEESRHFIDQLAGLVPQPLLVMTGGDPFKRPDLYALVHHAVRAGLRVAVTPSATAQVDRWSLLRLRDEGVRRLAVSMDGIREATHDGIRGVPGSMARTQEIVHIAQEIGLQVQINTTVSMRNVDELEAMADCLATRGIVLWSVFFLVPVGRGAVEERIPAARYETVFAMLWRKSRLAPFAIKTTEAPHFRRFVAQARNGNVRESHATETRPRPPLGLNDGKGVVFVSHTGFIYPSGFLPVSCGRVPQDSLLEVYRHHPVFRDLRDPQRLKGKCGACEFRALCGGSRARAHAVSGDYLAPEPDCVYQPAAWKAKEGAC